MDTVGYNDDMLEEQLLYCSNAEAETVITSLSFRKKR